MSDHPFPASYGQERIWIASRLQPTSWAYAIVLVHPIPSTVDRETITAALRRVVERHGSLRTFFRAEPDGLTQVVRDEVPVEVAHDELRDDLRRTEPDDREEQLQAAVMAEVEPPFALDRPPLWRARLLRGDDERWLLVLVCHHTIFDGTSSRILGAELAALYTAGPAPVRLPELTLQYTDWSAWQRDRQLTPARRERELTYWRERLAGAPPVHALPTDRPRSATLDLTGAEVRFGLAEEVTARVTALSRRLGVTEFAVLFAAYAVVIARTGGQSDVVIGVPVAGRDQAAAARLVGLFINQVVLRVEAAPHLTFEELVGRVAVARSEALSHSATPVRLIIDELGAARDPALAPLYQLSFNLMPGTQLNYGYYTARDELCLEVGGAQARLEYRTNLFDEDTVRALAARFRRVLAAGSENPGQRVGDLPLLDDDERAMVLGLGGAANPAPPVNERATTVPGLVLARAARTPDAEAVRSAGAGLTYGELVERAWSLADRLRAHGIGPERLVAIALPRGTDLMIGLLGVLLAGGAYLPLDPYLPPARLEYILADSGATVLLAPSGTAPPGTAPPGTAPSGVTVLNPGEESTLASGDRRLTASPANVAYVIYTSGSTGRPKGAAIEHRSFAHYVRWFADHHGLGPGDRMLASTSPSFDGFGEELFPVLVAGGTVVLAPQPAGLDRDALLALAADAGATMMCTVPTILRMLVESPALSRCRALRSVVVGGEQLTGDLAGDFAARLPVPLHNTYGPTETTVAVTQHTCPPGERLVGPVPIGTPIAGARLYLLDDGGALAPVGAVGHLHVGGPTVGRGYPGRPSLTAERFRPDPFGPPGSRRYRTGDLARWTPDGELLFLGRADAQVKLRGLRIEPAEVEALLREQPGVGGAVVVVREDRPGDQRLVAYVRGTGPVDPAPLRAALRAHLPAYLVPAAIVAVDAFPVTTQGKLDPAALPAPDYAAVGRPSYVAPRSAAEELVAATWAEVLGVDRVGAEDDFFTLGGHSLLAARVAIRLSDTVGIDVPIHLFFQHPTLAELATAVEDLLAEEIDELTDDEAARLLRGTTEWVQSDHDAEA